MNLDNIRIKVSKKFHPLYRELTQDSAVREKIFPQHGDLFTLCMLVGYRTVRRNREFKGADLFWSHSLNKHQQTAVRAVAIAAHDGQYEVLSEPNTMIQVAEEFADGGMEQLLESVLAPYAREENGEYILRFTEADQLEKSILNFVLEEAQKDPLS